MSSPPAWHSAIYEGTVTHARTSPRAHAFGYGLRHVYLDLDEVDALFAATRWWRRDAHAPASLREQDYLPGAGSLATRVRDVVATAIGRRVDGAIRLLTQVRLFGISFNPVSFFYCFDVDGSLSAIVAEITNIPWLERHCYVLDYRAQGADPAGFVLDKRFHISPFMRLAQRYRWHFSVPGETLNVAMASDEGDAPFFRATLAHHRLALTPTLLDRLLWREWFAPLRVIAAIHVQAARLWWKGVPFIPHPSLGTSATMAPAPTAPAILVPSPTAAIPG